jgi:spore germination protein YaaH
MNVLLFTQRRSRPNLHVTRKTMFQVADRDTLTSVAARFDTTPSELTKLNRLATPYIFPGQHLYVPIRESNENESEGSTPVEDSHDDLPPEEKGLFRTAYVT